MRARCRPAITMWRFGVHLLLLPAFAGLVGLVSTPASAVVLADESISVGQVTVENKYPAEIRFRVVAESDSEIRRVTLRTRVVPGAATAVNEAAFTPATKTSAEYVWNTQRRYIPPGVTIEYYWQLEDAAGHQTKTDVARLTLEDTRFNWQNLTADKLTLLWYEGDRLFAQDLLDAGTRAAKQLADDTGVALDRPVKILIYETQRDLAGALPPRGVDWVGGEAFADYGVIVVNVAPSAAGTQYGLRAIPHELSHLVVRAATDNPFGGLPQWLNEGLAMYVEGSLPAAYSTVLQRANADNSLLSLKSLAGSFPTDDAQSLLGYAESYSVVKYLLDAYGRDDMSRLLAVFRDGTTADDALRKVYGKDTKALEDAWRDSLVPSIASDPTAATPVPLPAGSPAPSPSGRSCFGGLLSVGAVLGGLFLFSRRAA